MSNLVKYIFSTLVLHFRINAHYLQRLFFFFLQHSPSIAFPCTASIGIIDSGLSGQRQPWKQTPCARCQSGPQAPGLSRWPHLVSTCPWEQIMRRPWRAHTSIWKTSSLPFVTGNSLQRSVFINSYKNSNYCWRYVFWSKNHTPL